MGKGENLQEESQRNQRQNSHDVENQLCCCELFVRRKFWSLKCVVVLVFGLAALVSGIFWILPLVHQKSGFDAKESIKLSASVQASFRLEMPVSQLLPYIRKLEYDIYEEIGVPDTQVVVLSIHKISNAPNWTTVIFGVLSNPINVPINSVSLTVLRSSLIELFLEQSNLTLTTSIFGQPFNFEILKCPEGITVNPMIYTSIWQIPQILFNFTLFDSISEIRGNFTQFEDELKNGLHLESYENIYVQITNAAGSTVSGPVLVQASVMSDVGGLQPQRLKQLAKSLKVSPPKNLGLNNSTFGPVRSVKLSSYLEGTLNSDPPLPSPAPAPGSSDSSAPLISPVPAPSPSHYPALSPDFVSFPPCSNCEASAPSDDSYALPPSPADGQHDSSPPLANSPAPSIAASPPPNPCPDHDPIILLSPAPVGLTPHSSPSLSPAISPGPSRKLLNENASVAHPVYKKSCLLGFAAIVIFHLLCSWY